MAYTVDPIQLFLKQQILTDTNTLIEISSGPDSFDSILLEDKMRTQGMLGTVLEGMDERTNDIDDGQIVKKIRDTEAAIKPENSLTHPLEASPPSPFESDDVNNTKKPLVIAANSSMSVLSIGLDSNDKGDFRLEQLFICPYCTKFKSNLEGEYQRHIVLKHPGKPGYPNAAEDCNR